MSAEVRQGRHPAWALAALLIAGCATAPDAPHRRSIDVELAGSATAVDVYRAQGRARGTVLIAHGFARSRVNFARLADELSGDGWTVLVPELAFGAGPSAAARAIVALWAQRNRAALHAGDPLVLIGFSAGAAATLIAATQIPATVAWIGLDGVDRDAVGARAAGAVRAPAYVLRAPAAACNAHDNAAPWRASLPDLREDVLIDGASHCDFEAPSDAVCALACGGADEARQRAIRQRVRQILERLDG